MDSTSRLYERLGRIPQDPEDPESLEDLIVCAFGAFERFYVCWKTRGGEYRQGEYGPREDVKLILTASLDGHDLPSSLQEWLYPADGSTRDYPSLQVVFGRGDEYFASDKNGKLENKEPEIKKPPPSEDSAEKQNKPALRRARTISFLRPLSDASTRSSDSIVDTPTRGEPGSRRSSNTSQPPSSRPPSMSFSRLTSDPMTRPPSPGTETDASQMSSRRSSYISHSTAATSTTSSRPTSDSAPKLFSPISEPTSTAPTIPKDTPLESPLPLQSRLVRRSRPLSISFNPSTFPKIVEGKTFSPSRTREPPTTTTTTTSTPVPTAHIPCTCGCLDNLNPPPPPSSKPTYTYADASVQTEPESPQRTALRIDTSTSTSASAISAFPPPSYTYSYNSNSTRSSALDIQTPLTIEEEEYDYDSYDIAQAAAVVPAPNPVYMGRMLDYFSRPGYQLGDSLMSSYYYHEEPQQQQQQQEQVYYYEEEVAQGQAQGQGQQEWKGSDMVAAGDARIVS